MTNFLDSDNVTAGGVCIVRLVFGIGVTSTIFLSERFCIERSMMDKHQSLQLNKPFVTYVSGHRFGNMLAVECEVLINTR